MRLTREEYVVVQRIYYPGFTIGGISEPASLLAAPVLLLLTLVGGARFWMTVAAIVGLSAMQAGSKTHRDRSDDAR